MRPAGPVEEAPRWPWWFAPLGFAVGLLITVFAGGLLAVAAGLFGMDVAGDPPEFVLLATLVQDTIFVIVAILLASRIAPPRAWQFGLRPAPPVRAVIWTVALSLGFLALVAAYSALISAEGKQSVADDVGANGGIVLAVAAAAFLVLIAPVAEEFFFRGFFYRALRTSFGAIAAALMVGGLFGVIHYRGPDTLVLLPILGLLGVVFCVVFEQTKTLYAVVALHSANNAVALTGATSTSQATIAAFGFLGLTLLGCFLVPRWQRKTGHGLPG